ncbi:MAG: VWA domain-containing protein [Lentisphaerae bacterium]|nr:VWA domain-containing protein [Lentisphaerota bacterium]
MFQFVEPLYFLLAIPLLLAVWLVFRRRIARALLFAPVTFLPAGRPTWRIALTRLLPVLYLLGLALFIPALARPRTVFSRITQRSNAIAIQMLVDVSGSMQALDFSTPDTPKTRLDVVKETFTRFILQRPDDLVGLVVFAGYASSLIPLTLDHDAVLLTLKTVETPKATLDSEGRVSNSEEMLTAIGDGLATACARLENIAVKSRIIVLLSDGESNTGLIKPDDAIQIAKSLGIKVYVIGVGSTGLVPFMGRDMFGRQRIGRAEVRLDEEQLKKIAAESGGAYYNAKDTRGLDRALRTIDQLEKTAIRKDVYNRYDELFVWFLWPGAALLLLAVAVNLALMRQVV